MTSFLLALLFTCAYAQSDDAPSNESSQDSNVSIVPVLLYPEPDSATNESSNITVLLEETFPFPSLDITQMVIAAKEFVHQYLTVPEWLNMKKLLRVIKEIGGTRRDAHRAVSIYLGRVLSPEKRQEIEDRKEELESTFGGSFRR